MQWIAKQVAGHWFYGVVWPHVVLVEEPRNADRRLPFTRCPPGRRTITDPPVSGAMPPGPHSIWGLNRSGVFKKAIPALNPDGEIPVVIMCPRRSARSPTASQAGTVFRNWRSADRRGRFVARSGLPRQYEHPTVSFRRSTNRNSSHMQTGHVPCGIRMSTRRTWKSLIEQGFRFPDAGVVPSSRAGNGWPVGPRLKASGPAGRPGFNSVRSYRQRLCSRDPFFASCQAVGLPVFPGVHVEFLKVDDKCPPGLLGRLNRLRSGTSHRGAP